MSTEPTRAELEKAALAGLHAEGYTSATAVAVSSEHLKGGYICETLRVEVSYDKDGAGPATAIIKRACESGGDHEVAVKLKLYDREWQFYESKLAAEVPVRVPGYLGSLRDATGRTYGVLLEDLCQPGAVLSPDLDEQGVILTAQHAAKLHAKYWNDPRLDSGELGIRRHDDAWFKPAWQDACKGYWPTFEAKWRAREGALPDIAFDIGKALVEHYDWVQTAISSAPHTFVHGDVKPGNMFLMGDGTPAFIDWQYTAVGKGCSDLCFMIIEGYDVPTAARLEPIVRKAYLDALIAEGVKDYDMAALERDWQLATLHFPFYVAMWFGTTPDEQLVDPDFPRRFVPRAFEAIIRHKSHELLPKS